MPKLLQINVDADNGSNGGIARDVGRLVHESGWDSYIAYGRRYVPNEDSKLIRIGSALNVFIHGIESRLFDNHGLSSRIATFFFIKKIKKIKPDVVQLHNIHGYYINYRMLFNYLTKENIPTFFTFHDLWPITGHCSHFCSMIGDDCMKWKSFCCKCPKYNEYPKSLFADCSSKNYNIKKKVFSSHKQLTIIAISNYIKRSVEDSFLSQKPIVLIPNALDVNLFKPTKSELRSRLDLGKKKVLIGVAVSWSVSKGLYDYYKLSALLDSALYQIILIGLKKEQIEDLPKNIIGIKRTDSVKELVQYYSMADIVLNLSWEESFGMTTIEGMACGTPSIVYDRTASPELVSPDTGVVVKAGCIKDVVSAIKEICNKGKEFYCDNCRNRVVKLYNKDINFNMYFDLYKNALKKGQ